MRTASPIQTGKQSLDLGSYRVHIGDLSQPFQEFLQRRKYSKVFIITDEHTSKYCLPLFLKKLNFQNTFTIQIPSGETNKNLTTCAFIWQEMMRHAADRRSLTINLGGGVIGDMGGFCAGTFKRGMDFVQVPTTLLSQVDASIGGKMGIDFEGIKNSIGIFCDPAAVFVDTDFLTSLPEREIRSGFAEMIKHALIGETEQWVELKQLRNFEHIHWSRMLVASLQVKQRIVQEDPYERGIRKALNFGHTIGHAVESIALETANPLLHGEAIAIGMVCETWLSCEILGLPNEILQELQALVLSVYPHRPVQDAHFDALMALMLQDKKNEHQHINFTLIKALGEPAIDQKCSEILIKQSIYYYNNLKL